MQSPWKKITEETILAICDQQLITGLGVLTAGYVQVFYYDLSAYYWNSVVYLAWISSTTHLVTISMIRDKLNASKVLRNIRLCVMLCILAMLVAALVPTMNDLWYMSFYFVEPIESDYLPNWNSVIATPAKCFWKRGVFLRYFERIYSTSNLYHPPLVTSIFLVSTYALKVSHMFDRSRNWTNLRGRARIETALEVVARRNLQHSAARNRISYIKSRILHKVVIRTYVLYVLAAELLDSVMATILGLVTILAWGTMNLIIPSTKVDPNMQRWEREMGFGQILPLLLLLQPIFVVIQLFFGKRPERISVQMTMVADNIPAEKNSTYIAPRSSQAGNLISFSPTTHPTLTAVFSDTAVLLLTPREKVGGQRHDPVLEHLYLSKAFRLILLSTSILYLSVLAIFSFLAGYGQMSFDQLWMFGSLGFVFYSILCIVTIACSKELN